MTQPTHIYCQEHGGNCGFVAGHKGFCFTPNHHCLCDIDCPPDHAKKAIKPIKLDPKSYQVMPEYDDEKKKGVSPMKRDVVAHYTTGEIETIDYIFDKLGYEGGMAYIIGNEIKYSSRANHKGQRRSDLVKIRNYATIALEQMDKYAPEEK